MERKVSVKIRTLKLRTTRHITQQQLARRANLSKTTISNLESGRQTKIELETIAKLCKTLHCTPSDLFEISEDIESVHSQKAALAPFIGEVKYDAPFKPETLESELAKMIDKKKGRKR
ncbi:MAG: helix-turn-helix transcriptional regulator [Parachlamydia sp.]|nr:helix-turn-helix transcriptional regulator [Parachlamydia sp.]